MENDYQFGISQSSYLEEELPYGDNQIGNLLEPEDYMATLD